MLKRYQVLLTSWMGDYAKWCTEHYDLSFSEVIRILVCLGSTEIISALHPEFKTSFSAKKLAKAVKDLYKKGDSQEEMHKIISQTYFETRKAVEYRIAHADNKKKIRKK